MSNPLGLAKSNTRLWTVGALVPSLVILTFLLALSIYYYRSWKRLAHIPGPSIAHISIIWLLRHAWNGRLTPCLIEAGEKYGPLARIGPNLLLCSDAEELRCILGVRSGYTKGPAYDAGRVTDGDPHVASERDPVKHKELRAKMGPAYSLDVQPAIDRQVSKLIGLINSKYTSVQSTIPKTGLQPPGLGRFMDFSQKMRFYTFDLIGDFAFGEPFGFLHSDEDVRGLIQIGDLSMRMVTAAGLVPWLVKMKSKWPFSHFLPKQGDKVGFGILFDFARDLVDRRTAVEATPMNDMMQAFIRSGMTKDQLMQQVYIHMIAGTEASANWASMIMLCLLTCPPAYMALQREIDAASACGDLSSPIATDSEARTLPYLDSVLREALRLHPPSTAPSKLSPQKGGQSTTTLSGFTVPAGTQVGANIPGILRSQEVFGPDAGCFCPERWLKVADGDEDRLNRMKSTLDLAFGAGKFQCLGKAIAWMQVRKLYVELLRNFDFSIVNTHKPLHVEWLAIVKLHDFNVRITRRETVKAKNASA
ncbi:cytochrome P450 [Hypoxylon sp. FL1150]|nr:cytochrome P450 [Hypoxylon sp. FL1150]